MNLRFALLALALAACRQAPPAPEPARAPAQPPPAAAPAHPPDHVTLVFAASVAGQLVPCGCSPDQRGGMPRAVGLVQQLRKDDPNLVFIDAGDLLFETASAPPRQLLTQRTLKAKTLAQGDVLLSAALRAVGTRDLALGDSFVAETAGGVPLADARTGGSRLIDAGGVKIGVFAAGLEKDPAATIAARARALREQGARIVVALLHPQGDNAWAAAQGLVAGAQGVDLAVLGRRDDPASDPNLKEKGPPPLFAVEGHGQSLLRIDLHLGDGPLQLAPSAEDRAEELKAIDVRIQRFEAQLQLYPQRKALLESKIKELKDRKAQVESAPLAKPPAGSLWAEASFLPLTDRVPPDEQAQKLVDAYDEKVAQINLAEAKSQPEECSAAARGELAYVGANKCAECHQTEAEFWLQTRHAHAYETLVAVKKQFSLDCIRCHVTGWQQPGGVCRIDRTARGEKGFANASAMPGSPPGASAVGRQDVQCEACHGPGSEHVADPSGHIRAEVSATQCMRCHEAANSPKFDYAKYRPFIVGPGHGEPLAKGQKVKAREGVPE